KLTELILSNTKLNDPAVKYLADALGAHETLEELRISSNSIDLLGGQAIAEAVQDNKVLV
ncbi:unnamed protein product, partial [Rotaria magnacalcarata]